MTPAFLAAAASVIVATATAAAPPTLCKLAGDSLEGVVAGAKLERLHIATSESCTSVNDTLSVKITGAIGVMARLEKPRHKDTALDSKEVVLVLENIPADWPQSAEITIGDGDGVLKGLPVIAAPKPTEPPRRFTVSYNAAMITFDDNTATARACTLPPYQDGPAVAPLRTTVENSVTLDLPRLRYSADLEWSLIDASPDVLITQCVGTEGSMDHPRPRKAPCTMTEQMSRIRFVTDQATSNPIVATIAVDYRDAPDHSRALAVPVMLAKSAERRSIPLPLAQTTAVACSSGRGLTRWTGNELSDQDAVLARTLAIDNDAVTLGRCSLWILPEKLPDDYVSYGVQLIHITVGRSGAAKTFDKYVKWNLVSDRIIDCKNLGTTCRMPRHWEIPIGPIEGDSDSLNSNYDVHISTLPLDTPIALESKTLVDSAAIAAALDPRYSQSYVLRPVGTFAGPLAVRIQHSRWTFRWFITVPTNLLGLRFPAKPRALPSDHQTTAVQVAGPSTGVLFVVEPWNYLTGTDSIPLKPWLQSGFRLIDVKTLSFSPATLVGVSTTIPILPNDGKVPATAAFGAFWEHSFGNGGQWDSLLLTLGINLFTFLGAN